MYASCAYWMDERERETSFCLSKPPQRISVPVRKGIYFIMHCYARGSIRTIRFCFTPFWAGGAFNLSTCSNMLWWKRVFFVYSNTFNLWWFLIFSGANQFHNDSWSRMNRCSAYTKDKHETFFIFQHIFTFSLWICHKQTLTRPRVTPQTKISYILRHIPSHT